MAIRLTNGTMRTMSYEDLDQYLNTLRQRQGEYKEQTEFIAGKTFEKFKELVKDYKAGVISKDVFHAHLKKMIPYFQKMQAPYVPTLHANQILETLEKEGIRWS